MPMQPSVNPEVQGQEQPQGKSFSMTAQPQEQGMMDDEGIVQGLEEHLNNISPDQKAFLVKALEMHPEIVIPVLGIVNGQEVHDYFNNIYESKLAPQAAQAEMQRTMNPQGAQSTQQAQPPRQMQPMQTNSPAPQGQPNQGMMNPAMNPQGQMPQRTM